PDRQPIDRRPGELAVDFPEIGVLHGELAEAEVRRADGEEQRVGVEELRLVWIPVVDAAEVEGELAEREPNPAVDVELTGGRGRELAAPAPATGVELDLFRDVAAGLDIAGDGRAAGRLRAAAGTVAALNAAADRAAGTACW